MKIITFLIISLIEAPYIVSTYIFENLKGKEWIIRIIHSNIFRLEGNSTVSLDSYQ